MDFESFSPTSNVRPSTSSALSSTGTTASSSSNNDLIVCVVFNSQRESLLLIDPFLKKNLSKSLSSILEPYSFWFPYIRSNQNETTLEAASRLLSTIEIYDNETVNDYFEISTVLRIHSNHLLAGINSEKTSRVVYVLCNSHSNLLREQLDKIDAWCLNIAYMKWLNLVQIKQAIKRQELLGLEPFAIYKEIVELKSLASVSSNIQFFFHEPKMTYIEPASSQNQSAVEQLVLSAKFTRDIQDQLFALFYSYAYPSEYMNLAKFKLFIQKLVKLQAIDVSLQTNNSFRNYFYAFDLNHKSILTYNDLLLGLAAMEPSTQHGGTPAEQRCRYIFRYYTFSDSIQFSDDALTPLMQNQVMNFEQFKSLMRDINTLKKTANLDEKSLEQEATSALKLFGLINVNDGLTLSDFLIGVGQLKFRGTSVLFRLSRPIIDVLSNQYDFYELKDSPELIFGQICRPKLPNKLMPPKADVNMAKSKVEKRRDDYELATHTVKVKRTGDTIDNMRIDRIWDLDGATTPNILMKDSQFHLNSSSSIQRHQIERITSGEFFNQDTKPNQMLYGLRYFEVFLVGDNKFLK